MAYSKTQKKAYQRLQLICQGIVQGVGFRPTIYRLASAYGLSGFVQNTGQGVIIEIEGASEKVEAFVKNLPSSLPPLARLEGLIQKEISIKKEKGFVILPSPKEKPLSSLVPPDLRICSDCLREMKDPHNRRYRYPFITCTHCGPRFSLLKSLPYDRARTSMGCFPLCPDCAKEYHDPLDRRFHAEPIACPTCGPQVWLTDRDGKKLAEGSEAILRVQKALKDGKIVAIKGLGGFQLACDAENPDAIATLRKRKRRKTKPFACMVKGIKEVLTYGDLSPEGKALLTSPEAPILLLPAKKTLPLIAPGLKDIGLMISTTPLHHCLFLDAPYQILVMTSGNISGEPICKGNREALRKLKPMADLFLLHNRDILRRVDDSVVRQMKEGTQMVRRARGYIPHSYPIPKNFPKPSLALGGYLQVTAALGVGNHITPSQHVGDLDSEEARCFLEEVANQLEELLEVKAQKIVGDAHPDYPSTILGRRWAKERGIPFIPVQHHLAHALAVMVEAGWIALKEPVLALIFDGTGYGLDGTSWGGEWLLLEEKGRWQRLAHLPYLPLVGGDQAIREPWRVGLALLEKLQKVHLWEDLPIASQVDPALKAKVLTLLEKDTLPKGCGLGRYFEGLASLMGLCAYREWEGEGAALLEALADEATESSWKEEEMTLEAVISQTLEYTLHGELKKGAMVFHQGLIQWIVKKTLELCPEHVQRIVLGGGCWINRHLLDGVSQGLKALGFQVAYPHTLPPGDGSLSVGQLAYLIWKGED